MLVAAATAVHQARLAEDAAYRRFSGKDFASDDLKVADQLEDKYMSTVHVILNGLLYLPESEPKIRKAQQAVKLFKDFGFSTNDGIEAEARKTTNMVQQWGRSSDYTLAELGIQEWVEKARQQAQQVLALVAQRVENESAKVKGELAAARKQSVSHYDKQRHKREKKSKSAYEAKFINLVENALHIRLLFSLKVKV